MELPVIAVQRSFDLLAHNHIILAAEWSTWLAGGTQMTVRTTAIQRLLPAPPTGPTSVSLRIVFNTSFARSRDRGGKKWIGRSSPPTEPQRLSARTHRAWSRVISSSPPDSWASYRAARISPVRISRARRARIACAPPGVSRHPPCVGPRPCGRGAPTPAWRVPSHSPRVQPPGQPRGGTRRSRFSVGPRGGDNAACISSAVPHARRSRLVAGVPRT